MSIIIHRRHRLGWYQQTKRDLNNINPYLFGVIIIVLSSTFVGSLGVSLILNIGWALIGSLTMLVGMATVSFCAVLWVAGKMPNGPKPKPLVMPDTWTTEDLDKFIHEFDTARFGVLQVAP